VIGDAAGGGAATPSAPEQAAPRRGAATRARPGSRAAGRRARRPSAAARTGTRAERAAGTRRLSAPAPAPQQPAAGAPGGNGGGGRHLTARATADRRERARPGADQGHRRRWPHHAQRRGSPPRRDRGGAPGAPAPAPALPPPSDRRVENVAARTAAGAPRPATTIEPFDNIRRRHRRAHGAVECNQRARLHVGRGRLRAHRTRSGARNQQQWKAEEGFSLTYLQFIVRAVSTSCTSTRTSTRASTTRACSCTATCTWASRSTLDFRGLVAPVIRKRRRQAAAPHRP